MKISRTGPISVGMVDWQGPRQRIMSEEGVERCD